MSSEILEALSAPAQSTEATFSVLVASLVNELLTTAPRSDLVTAYQDRAAVSSGSELWHPSLDGLFRLARNPADDSAMFELMLRLIELGANFRASQSFAIPQASLLARWLLRHVVAVEIDTALPEFACFDTDTGGRVCVEGYANDQLSWRASLAPCVVPVGDAVEFSVVPGYAVAHRGFEYDDFEGDCGAFALRVRAALALIAQCSPEYISWVSGSVKLVSPLLATGGGKVRGGSVASAPGLIQVGDSSELVDIADTLIHEASHQYFFVARHFGSFSSDGEARFFSPFVGEMRDVTRLLMTYHAFGNALLFHNAAAERGSQRSSVVMNKLIDPLDRIAKHLDGDGRLTPIGIALYAPLNSRIRKLRKAA